MKYSHIKPFQIAENKRLSIYYGMPLTPAGYIKWKGPDIPVKVIEYLIMIKKFFKQKFGPSKTLSYDDVMTILELRHMAAHSSLRNYQEQGSSNPNYMTDFKTLQEIMQECDRLYKRAIQKKKESDRRISVQMPIPDYLKEFFS